MNADCNLILVRGVSGAGKSTIGEMLGEDTLSTRILSTDDLFYIDGKYEFKKIMDEDPDMLRKNHQAIIAKVEQYMKDYEWQIIEDDWSYSPVDRIVVCNTFTQMWEMEPYFDLAISYDWRIHTIIVENRHGSDSIHDVPADVIKSQRERFEVTL